MIKPMIGIVMPYYNEPELLVKAVNAIILQTYQNWHLYLVDDGSEEGKRAMDWVTLSSEIDDKVTIVLKAHRGVSAARNAALELIGLNPEIRAVAYCDADDVWDHGYLDSQVRALDECDLTYSADRPLFVDGTPAIPYGILNPPEYPGLPLLIEQNFIYISGVVHKLECLEIGGFDSELDSIEDWDFWVRIAKAGFKIKKNKVTCFTYTVKPSGNMASKRTPEITAKFRQKHSK